MKKFSVLIAFVGIFPATLWAQQPVLGAGGHVAYVANDAGSGSDFDGSGRLEGFGLLQFSPHVSLEAGLAMSTAAEDSGSDNQGSYSLEISSNEVFTGLRLDTSTFGPMNGYGRAGVLYYHSEIEFQEDFFGIKPGGSLEEVEEGTGFYLEGGLAFRLSNSLRLDAGLTYRVRQDYFEDSSRPFDMSELGIAVGLVIVP